MHKKKFFTFCRFTGSNKNQLLISILVLVSSQERRKPTYVFVTNGLVKNNKGKTFFRSPFPFLKDAKTFFPGAFPFIKVGKTFFPEAFSFIKVDKTFLTGASPLIKDGKTFLLFWA
jgi:hypothetical protein